VGKVVTLPKICGLYSFEQCLLAHSRSAAQANEVQFDFGELSWIGTLPLSLLYSWIRETCERGATVSLNLAETESNRGVLRVLSRARFFHALNSLQAGTTASIPPVAPTGMAVFQPFDTAADLTNYERALASAESVDDILRGGSDIEIVNTGYLREILLHELGENAFLHGNGKAVRLVAFQRQQSHPDRGGVETWFDGRPIVEILVSDDGPGLIKNLGPTLPDKWQPSNRPSKPLSIGARVCAYALEFSTTSDVDGRKRRLREILASVDDVTECIPTGLYYVATLVRHYGGQLIVRTGRNLVSFNYTQAGDPITTENAIGRQGHDVKGTHVLIRLPKDARPTRGASPARLISLAPSSTDTVHELVLESFWHDDPADFVVRVEHELDRILSLPRVPGRRVLVLLAHALSADTKTVALLLTWLGTIPHRNWIVAVCGLNGELFDSALKQSERLCALAARDQSQHRLKAFQPFAVADAPSQKVLMFGSTASDEQVSSAIAFWHVTALTQSVRRILENPPVRKHEAENRYYLIEGKYYTKRFYEIRQLTSPSLNKIGAALSAALVANWVREAGANTILVMAEPLVEFAALLATFAPNARVVTSADNSRPNPFTQELVLAPPGTRFFLLTDVVCTGVQFVALFGKLADPKNCWIGAFVDAREKPHRYITIERTDGAQEINIYTALRTQIPAITKLPDVDDAEVLLIDRRTHAPTPKDQLEELMMTPTDLIASAHRAKALYHGHVALEGKHYIDLIDLSRLFQQMQSEIYGFFDRTLRSLQEQKTEPHSISVFYLYEDRGWEDMVPNFLQSRGVSAPRRISRDQLLAPPAEHEAFVPHRCVWFILPAIASGETTRQCLEYGSRLKPLAPEGHPGGGEARIVVSAVIGRMAPAELSFYQGIRAYKRVEVLTHVFAFIPLPAYPSENDCPVCVLLRAADSNALRAEYSPGLQATYAPARAEIAALAVGRPNMNSEDWSSHDVTLSQMSALYRSALRNISARRQLPDLLEADGGYVRFIEMVGSHCDTSAFEQSTVARLLYKYYEPLTNAAASLLRADDCARLTLRHLLGLHLLFPQLLCEELTPLVLRALKESEGTLIPRLTFLAVLRPEEYGVRVAIAAHVATDVSTHCEGIAREIRDCSLWFGSEPSRAIDAYEQLLWLLHRSTDWGSGIEELRARLSGKSSDPTDALFRKFEVGGINQVLRHIVTIKSADKGIGLWSAICAEGGDPDPPFAKIVRVASEMRALVQSGDSERGALLQRLSELDDAGRELLATLRRSILTNPARLKHVVEQHDRWPELKRWHVEVTCDIAPDCPGLLFGFSHFSSSLNAILENISMFLRNPPADLAPGTPGLRIQFRFVGFNPTQDAAMLEVHGNIPFRDDLQPRGGLKQAAEHCKIYGAILDFSPPRAHGSTLWMRFHIRIDRSRRNHEQNLA
jgi:hypothetical protein